jgi:hypothetical protein
MTLGLAGNAQAQSLVIRATGPIAAHYPAGTGLAANARLSLAPADRIVVLDKSGTLVLSGPGTFVLDGKLRHDTNAWVRVRSVFANGKPSRSRTAGVRGGLVDEDPSNGTRPPHVWFVDVGRSGHYCLVPGATLALWRADANLRAFGIVASARDGATVRIMFKPGDPLAPWPSAMTIMEGMTYTLQGPSGKVAITTHLLGGQVGQGMELLSQLAEKGCMAQFALVASAAANSADDT